MRTCSGLREAGGRGVRATLRIVSIDVNKLPDMFVVRTANEGASGHVLHGLQGR